MIIFSRCPPESGIVSFHFKWTKCIWRPLTLVYECQCPVVSDTAVLTFETKIILLRPPFWINVANTSCCYTITYSLNILLLLLFIYIYYLYVLFIYIIYIYYYLYYSFSYFAKYITVAQALCGYLFIYFFNFIIFCIKCDFKL